MADDPKVNVERSAGVVVFRQDLFGNREYLLLDYGRHWDFAKGHIETGESDRVAAIRELFEETGIRDILLCEGFCREITYFFRARGKLVKKSVAFFAGRTESSEIRLSDEHAGFAWQVLNDAIAKLTYAGARDILKHADVFLSAEKR